MPGSLTGAPLWMVEDVACDLGHFIRVMFPYYLHLTDAAHTRQSVAKDVYQPHLHAWPPTIKRPIMDFNLHI